MITSNIRINNPDVFYCRSIGPTYQTYIISASGVIADCCILEIQTADCVAVAVECAFEIIARSSNRCPTVSWCAVESTIGVKHGCIYFNVFCQDGTNRSSAIVHFIGKPIKVGCIANSVVVNKIGCKTITAVVAFGYQSALSKELAASSAASSSIHRRVLLNNISIAEYSAWLQSIYHAVAIV